MGPLLKLSHGIDWFNDHVGSLIRWLVLAAVLISATNAIIRKAFDVSSNAFLEIQWYLFAGVFMLGAGYAFLRNVNVRIDFVSSKLSKRAVPILIGLLLLVRLIGMAVAPLMDTTLPTPTFLLSKFAVQESAEDRPWRRCCAT